MNAVYRYLQLTVIGLAAAAGPGARGQTKIPPAAAAGETNSAVGTIPAGGTNVTALPTTTVVGHLNEVREQIVPSLGATESIKDETQILSLSQGANAPINQVITRFSRRGGGFGGERGFACARRARQSAISH
jgi:hypothetical protein